MPFLPQLSRVALSYAPARLNPVVRPEQVQSRACVSPSDAVHAETGADLLIDAAVPWLSREGGPIKLKVLDDYVKMAGGQHYERSAIDRSFPMNTVTSNKVSSRGARTLSLQNLKLLVAMYVSVCQARAYLPDTTRLDLAGFSRFLAARFRMSPEAVGKLLGISAQARGEPSRQACKAIDFAKRLRTAEGVAVGKINTSGQEICSRGFASAYLVNAELDFCGRSYDRADFRGAALDAARMKDGVMKNAVFGHTSMIGTQFDSMTFDGCFFPASVNLESATFTDCKFVNCKFDRCNMNGVALPSGEIADTSFIQCALKKSRLGSDDNARASADRVLTVKDAKFESCNLEKVNIRRVAFNQCTFDHSLLNRSNISHSEFIECGLWMCQAANTRFKHVKMPQANCVGANFNNAEFESCDLRGAQFDFSQVKDIQLSNGVVLEGAAFNGTGLEISTRL